MKLYRLLLAAFLLLASIAEVKAQVSSENLVNIHNLNTTEISGLVSPAKGSLVYNTDSNKLFVFDGTLWVATASVDTTSLSARINQRVKYTDTAAMLIGYVRKGDTATMLSNYINGTTNGISKSGQNIKLGGTLTEATTITTSGTNTLTLAGVQSGASTDSIVTMTAAGLVRRISPSVLTGAGVKYSDTASMLSPYLRSALGVKYTDTASILGNYVNGATNGITKSGQNVKLGGTLTEATTITTSGTNTLTLAGLQSGASTDSLMTVTATGVVKRINPSVLTSTGVKYSDTASMLTPYLRKGDTASMLSPYLRSALGVKYTDTASMLTNYVNTSSNGITKTGKNVKLGGTLSEATTLGTSATNTFSLTGLQSGASTDSIMTITAAGVVKRINPSVLTSTGVKYSDTASMLTPYLRKGDTASMLSPYLRSALGVKYTDTASMLANYVNGATNGITKSGQNVKLGGALTEATTITTSGTNTLTLAGLQSGTSTDSLMTVTATGVVKRINPSVLTSTGVKYSDTASMLTPYLRKGDTASMLSPYLRSALGVKYTDTASMLGNYVNGATNGITKSGQNVKLGGTLTEATTITTSGTNTLTLAGLQSGASTDSLMTVTATGVVKRINPSVLTSTGVKYSDTASMLSPYLRSALGVKYTDTASMLGNYVNGATNGITKSGQNVKLGGTLTEATTITTSGTNTLTLAGLQSGASTDSLMTVTATGVVKRINPSVLTSTGVKYSDTASMLTPYLRKGDTASMLSPYLRSALGVKYTDTASMLANYVNGATNGITKSGQNVKLGGALTEATTITTSGTNTLTLAGLQSGASTDSLMTVTATGVVKRINPSVLTSTGVKYSDTSAMLAPYLRDGDTASMLTNYVNTSSNGITKTGKNVKLGGTLTEATTITTSGTNTLTLAGLQSGASTDSIVTMTSAGLVRRISPSVLTGAGVKYSDTASMLTPYLRKGDTASMLSPYLRSALGVKYTDTASMLANYVNGATNGITKSGQNVKLGGTLTEATTITTSGTNTLTLAGLQSGASTDSLMTVTATGVVKRINPSVLTSTGVKYSDTASMLTPYLRKGDTASMLSPYLRSALGVKYTDTASMLGNYVNGATNGITKSGQNVKLGGALTEATTITTSGTNTLTLAGLQSGASTDSLVTVTATGVVKRINPSVLTSTGVKYSDTASMLTPYLRKGDTASMLSPYLRSALGVKYTDTASMLGNYVNGATNGITKSGQNVKLGGTLTEATTITTSGTNTLTLAGLQSGASTDSLMTVTATGVVKRINPSVLTSTGVKYSDTASMLTPYLRKGDTATMLGNYVNGATNGITKSGQNVKLGGTLTEATTITTSGTNTLTLAGLQSGASTDSLMTITATGVVKRINPSVLTSTGVKYSDTASMLTPYLRKGDTASMLSPYLRSALGVKYTDTASMLTNYVNTSSNGITKTGKNVKLGGTLSEATTLGTSATNTFSLTGLQSGASTDSIMTITAAGVVKRINPSVLSSSGVKYTDTASMLTPYLRKGDTASMLSPYLRSALGVKYTDTASMLGNYVNGATNGITKSGQNVKLGGALSEATTIGASATNTLAITGLQNGSFSDSLLTITTGGVLRKTSVTTYTGTVMQYSDTAAMLAPYLRDGDTTAMLNNYINQAGNGLTKSGKTVQLGGSLSAATTLTTTASNTLAVGGLQSGSTNDSVVVADATTGVLKRIASSRLSSGGSSWSTTGNSGTTAGTNFIGTTDGVDLVFKANNIESGRLSVYNLSATFGYSSVAGYKSTAVGSSATTSTSTEATAIGQNAQAAAYRGVAVGSDAKATNNNAVALGQSATAAYQATALGSGASATGNNSTAIGYGASTAQANAIVLGGSSAQVGIGTSTPGYALDVTATSNPLRLGGVQAGASTDSLLTINTTTGVVRRVNPSLLSTSASNGLTMTGTNITLGGNLTAATTITNNANTLTFATGGSALNITGLAAGATTDSVLTINASGRVNRINAAAFTTTASNGLTMSGADARLGGSLTAATTITTSASNTLSLAGLQTSSLNDSVMMISSGNVVRRINAASVALEPFNVVGTTTKASSNTQNIYTSGNMSVGKSTNSATLEVAGKVKADSTVTAPNFVATFQDFGSAGGAITWNMQSGGTAAIKLTSNGTLTITNVTAGMYGLIKVQQDATGGRTITLPSGSKVINGGGGTVTLTSTANAVDVLTFFYDGTNYWWTIGNNYN